MSEKGWRGADLIFDLDGDHLHGISPTDFPNLISAIQDQTWSLWNDFLEPEFGFNRDYAQFTFSGHRGFHIHLRDPSLFHLDSNARREIVTYIRGVGLDVSTSQRKNSGWSRRLDEGIERISNMLAEASKGEKDSSTIKSLIEQAKGQNHPASHSTMTKLIEMASSEDHVSRLKGGSTNVFGETGTSLFWALVRANSSVSVIGGETDENVTVDVKRVIRHLGSLHGKSGLRVTEIPFERLDPDGSKPFDPLKEAIVFAGSENIKIRLLVDDVRAIINEREIEGNSGSEYVVDEGMAMFLQLKGWAELVTP
jgi:DNA primase small subunit